MIDANARHERERPTLFLRLEGPLQSWGGRTIGPRRPTESIPTKSGIVGLLGAALGLPRRQLDSRLDEFNRLDMTVRVDRAGILNEDFQTVGAGIGVLAADGAPKKTAGTGQFEVILSPREYLVDASFLVILQGTETLIDELGAALQSPHWPLFLGRKRCIPGTSLYAGLTTAMTLQDAVRQGGPQDPSLLPPDDTPQVRVVTELLSPEAFARLAGVDGAELHARFEDARSYVTDRLMRLDPPVHRGRIVLDFSIPRPPATVDRPDLTDLTFGNPGPDVPRRAHDSGARKLARKKSSERCLCCHSRPADRRDLHAHHRTYLRRGREFVAQELDQIAGDDLIMLCHECHAAVTMLEYQHGFGISRIDPAQPRWRERILQAREARRRHDTPEHPPMTPYLGWPSQADDQPTVLFESVVPLLAGSQYPDDAPGNCWLRNRHHVHQRLSMAFPDSGDRFAAPGYGVPRELGGFLFRIELGPIARLIVRSCLPPDWGRSFQKARWLVAEPLPSPKEFPLVQIHTDSNWTFCLEANPVKKLAHDGPQGRKGARVPLTDQASLRDWIRRQADKAGFTILENDLEIRSLGGQTVQLRSGHRRHWASVHFAGRLQVVDAALFREALIKGLGPAKGFGFGLLSIAQG